MNGIELLALLSGLSKEQLELDINLVQVDGAGNTLIEENIWLHKIEVSNTGDSGYEVGGEIRLIGTE